MDFSYYGQVFGYYRYGNDQWFDTNYHYIVLNFLKTKNSNFAQKSLMNL
ncbi:hypothetical protein LB467_09595 [Salegentibacter sp. JZCK2]|nr:hypothetical protein [Salegentibacter tibetensis]